GGVAPMDLNRYDQNGSRSYTTNSTAKAFFPPAAPAPLPRLANQNDAGAFGDWQSNPLPPAGPPKGPAPSLVNAARPNLGVELRALDVIGYTPVPEPSALALAGVVAAAWGAWRGRAGRRALDQDSPGPTR